MLFLLDLAALPVVPATAVVAYHKCKIWVICSHNHVTLTNSVKKLQAVKVFTFQVKNIYMIFDDIDGFFQQNDIKPYSKAISRQENTKNTLYYVTLY